MAKISFELEVRDRPIAPKLQQPSRYRIEYDAGRYTLYPGTGEPPRVNGARVTTALQLRAGDILEGGNGELLQLTAAVNSDGTQT